jgi:lipopolysaccharide export system protein LptA
MNVSVERLRVWLLVGAGLLVIVVVAFLGYAHYRAHRFLTNLPAKLGLDIRRETNGYTYSQSSEGKTIYTIHAAKAVERSDGKVTLHDVGIVLYGRKQDRSDRIYGNEFEYDQKNEVVHAVGEVHIDLQAPEAVDAKAKMDYAAGKDLHGTEPESQDPRLIHVTTSGLVFLQKLGMAATDREIEFESGGLTGHAVGADYNSDTGVVVLHSAVRVNGLQHDRPVLLTASHAVLDRAGQTVVLSQAKYVSVGGGGRAEGQSAGGERVVVHLRTDGSAERVEAEGNVTLTNADGGSVVAPRGEMVLNAQNQPVSAVMAGGVKYGLDGPLRRAHGEAAEGRAGFDRKGRLEQVTMTGEVRIEERVRVSANDPWSGRELSAATLGLKLVTDKTGRAQLRDAKATGQARLKVVNAAEKRGSTSSELDGDVLIGHFVRIGDADHISEVQGDGHTSLRRVSATGVVSTGSGDSLVAHFSPVTLERGDGIGAMTKGKNSKDALAGQGGDTVSDATELGHVVITELPARKPGDTAAPTEERATGERAVYDARLERATLTGNAQVSDETSVLWADRVVMEQESGDATADGSVKASYRQPGSADEPVHVLAARAELKHETQVATFHGVAGRPARLWQGASQVEAPVVQFDRRQRRLMAHGEGQGAPMAVHTVLVSGGGTLSTTKPDTGRPAAGAQRSTGAGGKTKVVRVASRDLVYSDEARKAEFTGGVEVESSDGIMQAQQVMVYLQAAKKNSPDDGKGGGAKSSVSSLVEGSGFMGGSVERMIATGNIELEQPGRRGTGEQIVYTASDGMFVLTGTPTVLPKVMDDQRGTVTGTSLQFHSGDNNIVVSNRGESGTGARVRTETRVKNKQ